MIVGRLASADGGVRRKNDRTIRIVDFETKETIILYLIDLLNQTIKGDEWFSLNRLFVNLPYDIIGTPIESIYEKCKERFTDSENQVLINLKKYIGICFREAITRSEEPFEARMPNSIKEYRKLINYEREE